MHQKVLWLPISCHMHHTVLWLPISYHMHHTVMWLLISYNMNHTVLWLPIYLQKTNPNTFVDKKLQTLTIVMWLPFKRIWSSCVTLLPSGVDSYSVTSSRTMLTKSSNPSRVPTISLSVFIMMWIREPMHLSTNSTIKYKKLMEQ